VCRLLTEALHAQGCLAYLVDGTGEVITAVAAFPAPADGLPELELPLGFGVAGRVAVDGIAAVLVDDRPRNPVHLALLGVRPGEPVSRLCLPCPQLVGPSGASGVSVAVLAVHDASPRVFSAAQVELGLAVARLVGLRIERDQAVAAVAEHGSEWEGLVAATVSAQEAERRRVAADLHDGVTQAVASLAFHLSAAEVALEAGGPDFVREQVREARVLADLAFREARSAISGLRSPVLDDLGLAAGLESLARSVRGVSVTVEAADVELAEHVSTALFRIAQEAISNIVKHAQASHVHVSLAELPSGVVLVVSDDGRGFDMRRRAAVAGAGDPDRFGLVGMFERAQLLGGRLVIESEPGAGTTVRAVIPRP
jgi:signal transduction histidine kinase